MNLLAFRDSLQQKMFTAPDAEKLDWLRLIRTPNIGPVTFYQLIETYGSASEALEILPELSQRGGRKKPLTPPSQAQIEREYKALRKRGGYLLTANDSDYPLALAATDDAPPVLSAIGDISLLKKSCVAIVGARNASLNGRKLAKRLSQELGTHDQVIASGLARGIDTAAHQGSLKTGTIAVVAGGIDVVYPEENQDLYNEIKEQGLILAESPLGQKPFAASFPRRNRIVSGLSKGVIVVESTLKSGSLITARLAGEQGRDVMAVPGSPLDPRAAGPNKLLRDGATLIRNAEDVLETLQDFSGNIMSEPELQAPAFHAPLAPPDDISEDLQNEILSQLSFTPVTVDELIRSCHVSIPALQTILLELELAERIKRLPGNRVTLQEED